MTIEVNSKTYFVFDLDDTIYPEYEFLRSAFRQIADTFFDNNSGKVYNEMLRIYDEKGNVFKSLVSSYPEKNLDPCELLNLYRNHFPRISLNNGVQELILNIRKKNGKTGILTDGRSITQRNKIAALGIGTLFDDIVISEEIGSEKPSELNYLYFAERYPGYNFVYIADNIAKDFITPKKMGWLCIGFAGEFRPIHKRKASEFSAEYLPDSFIRSMHEINIK